MKNKTKEEEALSMLLNRTAITIAPEKSDAFCKMIKNTSKTKDYWENIKKETSNINMDRLNALFDKNEK